jgi:hypothetical protein
MLFATYFHNTMDMVIYSGPSVVSVVEVSLRVIKTNNKILSYDWGRIVKNPVVRTNCECVYREREGYRIQHVDRRGNNYYLLLYVT